MKNKKILILSILVVMIFAGIVFSRERAVLYVMPSSGSYKEGETFKVKVLVNTAGNKINSARGLIEFSNNNLEVLEIKRDKSIFTFWDPTTSFSNNEGEIFFGGGLPTPGFFGKSGKIFEISFRAKSSGVAVINFKEGAVLLNDKEGTDILGKLNGAKYKIKEEKIPLPQRTPERELIQVPEITSYSEKISSTETFYVEGKGDANSIIILYIKKEKYEPIIKEIDVNSDGTWSYVHDSFLQPGDYIIYTKARSATGEISSPSEKQKLKVEKSGIVVIGFFIKNETIYGILILLLFSITLALFGYFIYDIQKRAKMKLKLMKEIKEANDSVIDGFGLLKEEIRRELRNLKDIKISEGVPATEKERRERFINDLSEDLELIERIQNRVRKEVKDIEDILPPIE